MRLIENKEKREKRKEKRVRKLIFLMPYALCLMPFIMAFSCKHNQDNNQSIETVTENKITKPDFSSDSAYLFTQQQVNFGARVPGTPAQQKCAAYFEQKLKNYGASVVVQKTNVVVYSGKSVPCINIIASYNPTIKRRLMICTHWDARPFADQDDSAQTKPILAADDGGSGSAILLEIARQLKKKNPEIGVDLIF